MITPVPPPSFNSTSSVRLRPPSVFIIPPVEEQEETPPWCCHDAADSHSIVPPTFATEPDMGTLADRLSTLQAPSTSPFFSRFQPDNSRETIIMPRRNLNHETGACSTPMDVDDDVIEVVRVGKKRADRETTPREQVRSEAWKRSKSLTLRARATQALKSVMNVGSTKNGTKGRKGAKDISPGSENVQGGDVAARAIPSTRKRDSIAAGMCLPEQGPSQSANTHEAPAPKPALSRRISQMFSTSGRRSPDPNSDSRHAHPPQPSLFTEFRDTSTGAPSSDGLNQEPRRSVTMPALVPRNHYASEPVLQSELPPRAASPGTSSIKQSSRRFSTLSLKALLNGGTSGPLTRRGSVSQASVSGHSADDMSRPTSPLPTRAPISRDANTVESDGSTEPPETPITAEHYMLDFAEPAMTVEDALGFGDEEEEYVDQDGMAIRPTMIRRYSKEPDVDGEMRLDSLHFDSLHFDAEEFDVSF